MSVPMLINVLLWVILFASNVICKTWKDVKMCVEDTVTECHHNCLRDMPSDVSNQTRNDILKCQQEHARMVMFAFQLCPGRHRFYVSPSTPCWSGISGAERRDFYEETIRGMSNVGAYGVCVADCWKNLRKGYFELCQLGCEAIEEKYQKHAVGMCLGAFDQTMPQDFAFLANEAKKCFKNAAIADA